MKGNKDPKEILKSLVEASPGATSRETEAKELPSQSRDEGPIGETYRNQSSIIGDGLRTQEKAKVTQSDLKVS